MSFVNLRNCQVVIIDLDEINERKVFILTIFLLLKVPFRLNIPYCVVQIFFNYRTFRSAKLKPCDGRQEGLAKGNSYNQPRNYADVYPTCDMLPLSFYFLA